MLDDAISDPNVSSKRYLYSGDWGNCRTNRADYLKKLYYKIQYEDEALKVGEFFMVQQDSSTSNLYYGFMLAGINVIKAELTSNSQNKTIDDLNTFAFILVTYNYYTDKFTLGAFKSYAVSELSQWGISETSTYISSYFDSNYVLNFGIAADSSLQLDYYSIFGCDMPTYGDRAYLYTPGNSTKYFTCQLPIFRDGVVRIIDNIYINSSYEAISFGSDGISSITDKNQYLIAGKLLSTEASDGTGLFRVANCIVVSDQKLTWTGSPK